MSPPHPNDTVVDRTADRVWSDAAVASPAATVASAAVVYLIWAAATYVLEGSLHTLLRPEARAQRLAYSLIANLLAGTVIPLWVLRRIPTRAGASPRLFRSRAAPCIAVSSASAAMLSTFMLIPLWRVAGGSAVCVNVFAQVLPTSIAEVLVCWVVVGAAVDSYGRGCGPISRATTKWLTGAVVFGLYHFAHSPPYNTWTMVWALAGVGLVTGAYFLATGELYGTILLHAGLATVGVIGSLSDAGNLALLQSPQPYLYLVAVTSAVTLVLLDAIWFRPSTGTA